MPFGTTHSAPHNHNFFRILFIALILLSTGFTQRVQANDLALASGSSLAGFTFDDRPLQLPPQRNFQMAMLTASSELGRSCGKMESYGWRMNQTEQGRVNQIFNSTVDRMRGLGYSVEAQAPTSVSRDITIFTADRSDKHFIMMWSAGELGLVMVLCETSAPVEMRPTGILQSVEVFSPPNDVMQRTLPSVGKRHSADKFSPVGSWVGGYTCEQGYTGGTLQITNLHGENFEGIFRFYPTPKNPYVATGRYTVFGQYDHDSHRVLINPGKWLERPKNYYNTVMVGSFDPVSRTFSAYFQGINGCTSFEAKDSAEVYQGMGGKAGHKVVKKKAKKKVAKKAGPAKSSDVTPTATSPGLTPTEVPAAPAPVGIEVPAPPAANPPEAATVAPALAPTPVPSAPATAAPEPLTPAAPPADIAVPTVTPAPAAAPTPAPAPVAPAAPEPAPAPAPPPPAAAPEPTPAPAPVTPTGSSAPSPDAPKPSGALEPQPLAKPFKVADSGHWFTPTVPPVSPAPMVNQNVPQVPQAQPVPSPIMVTPNSVVTPNVPQVYAAPNAPIAEQAQQNISVVPQAGIVPQAPDVTQPVYVNPTVPPVPQAVQVPDYRPTSY